MMITRGGAKKYYAVSFAMHMVLLLAMMITFQSSMNHIALGEEAVPMVNAYVMNMPPTKAAQQQAEAKQNKAIKLKKSIKQHQAVAQMKTVTAPLSASSHGEQSDELVSLLHSAIQRQQHYPASAMEMERQGRVLVTFTLLTNGRVQGLQVARSSGTESLDSAALEAVQAAVPFSNIDHYLRAAKDFSIEIVFELG